MMRMVAAATFTAAICFAHASLWAACAPRASRHCVNLDALPQISQDIVSDEAVPVPKRQPVAAPAAPSEHYTGPTIGLNRHLRRAPEIGYRWAIE